MSSLQKEQLQIKKMLWLQMIVVFLVAGLFCVFGGIKSGGSAWLGGLAWALPSIFFSHKIFFPKKPRKPAQILRAFYVGELLKFLLSAITLIIIFKYIPVLLFSLFTGYIVAIATLLFAPLVVINN